MGEWKELRVEDIASLVKDSWKVGDEHLPYIGLEHIDEGKLRLNSIGDSSIVASNKYRFSSSHILFGKLRPYFRKVLKPNFNGICSTDIWVLKNTEISNKDFIFYFFANQELIDLSYSSSGGTRMPRADWNFLSKTKWDIPPLEEQKAIAEVLSSLDDKSDLLHRQNKTLEQMAQTLFRQWFIEEADDNWEEKPLSKIADFLNGLACQKFPPENDIDKLPVLKIKDLKDGISDSSDWVTSDVKSEYIVESGDVIFAWSASLIVKLWDGQKCVLNQHLFKVTSEKYPKWFYYQWCKYHLDRFIAIAEAHATTMGHIKRKDLDNAMCVIPSNEELKNMNEHMNPLIDKIEHNSKQIKILENMRDTLLPKLMSGEVRVDY